MRVPRTSLFGTFLWKVVLTDVGVILEFRPDSLKVIKVSKYIMLNNVMQPVPKPSGAVTCIGKDVFCYYQKLTGCKDGMDSKVWPIHKV